jgi:hypothetical protein
MSKLAFLKTARNAMGVDPRVAIQQMRENCRRDLEWLMPEGVIYREPLVIVGGAPSVVSRIPNIAKRAKAGELVVAVNGAAKLLKGYGIEPDFVGFMDASPVVADFVSETDDECEYLVASICHPTVLDKLDNRDVTLWHAGLGEVGDPYLAEQQQILSTYRNRPWSLVGGGNTVTLRMMNVGYILGFRKFHFYGIDSSYQKGGADHAYAKHDGIEPDGVAVMRGNRTYWCSPWMCKQAEDFETFHRLFTARGCRIYVHGDGLIPDICKELNAQRRKVA